MIIGGIKLKDIPAEVYGGNENMYGWFERELGPMEKILDYVVRIVTFGMYKWAVLVEVKLPYD